MRAVSIFVADSACNYFIHARITDEGSSSVIFVLGATISSGATVRILELRFAFGRCSGGLCKGYSKVDVRKKNTMEWKSGAMRRAGWLCNVHQVQKTGCKLTLS